MKKQILITIGTILLFLTISKANDTSSNTVNICTIYRNDSIITIPSDFSDIETMHFSDQDKVIGFELAGISSNSDYEYMFFPYHKTWKTLPNKRRTIFFINPPQGKYLLKIKESDRQNSDQNTYNLQQIYISQSFFHSDVFYLFVLIAVLLLIFFYIRHKHLTQLKLQKRLEDLVEERTTKLADQNTKLEELNSTKNRLFSIIAHDLKSPLNALIGFSDLLLDKYDSLSNEKRIKFITVVNQSSKLMYEMLINLLDWARSQSGEIRNEPNNFRLFKIIRIAAEYNQSNAEKKGIEIETSIDKSTEIFVDYNMILTILRNIISNAIKYSKPNDTIKIFTTSENQEMITLAIKDFGVGMDSNQIENIFSNTISQSTLGTENEQGTGLGLLLCKDFINKIGGTLNIESSVNNGTTFYIDIPLYSKQNYDKEKRSSTKKILEHI